METFCEEKRCAQLHQQAFTCCWRSAWTAEFLQRKWNVKDQCPKGLYVFFFFYPCFLAMICVCNLFSKEFRKTLHYNHLETGFWNNNIDNKKLLKWEYCCRKIHFFLFLLPFAALVSWLVLLLGTREINEPNVLNWRFHHAAVVVSRLATAAGLWEEHDWLGQSVTARLKNKEFAIWRLSQSPKNRPVFTSLHSCTLWFQLNSHSPFRCKLVLTALNAAFT